MFLFPYRVDFNVVRFPWVTLAVALLCCAIYVLQVRDDRQAAAALAAVCASQDSTSRMAIAEFEIGGGRCDKVLMSLQNAADPEAEIRKAVDRAAQDSRVQGWPDVVADTAHQMLESLHQREARPPLTARLIYHPESWNPVRAITAALAHGSPSHLLGNLFFFYVFAATVEAILGTVRFVGLMLLLALGTHYCYSAVNIGSQALPTLGLSGVIMGVMGFFAWAIPDAKLRVAYWFLIRVGVTTLPAWFIVLWYAGFDAYHLYRHAGGHTNLIAHVSGAVLGALMAATLFRRPVSEARQLVPAL